MTQAEFEAIIGDESKRIEGDINWLEDEDHSSSVEFRAEVHSDAGYPLFVRGSYNRKIHALSYTVISKSAGRIYALDMGKDHRNADTQELIGEKHKHSWTEQFRDKVAYVPQDITELSTRPDLVWSQFCNEAKIIHDGELRDVPAFQPDLYS